MSRETARREDPVSTAVADRWGRPLLGQWRSATGGPIPPSWQILPIPRDADYGAPDDFVTLGTVAIVRKEGGPYQTVRDKASELVGDSTITEEELVRILGEHGVADLDRLPDDLRPTRITTR